MRKTKLIREAVKTISPSWFKAGMRHLRKLYLIILDYLGNLFFKLLFLNQIKSDTLIRKQNINKILVIRIDQIGDLILSTPAIRAIRRIFPDATIDVLVQEYTKDILINNPNVNRILCYKKDGIKEKYDLAISLQPGFIPNLLTFKSRAKIRLGISGWGGGFFLTHKISDNRLKVPRHEALFSLDVVRMIKQDVFETDLEISITNSGEEFAEEFLVKNNIDKFTPLVVIHPGAREKYKRWRKDGFAMLADKLISEKKVKVILIGDKQEKDLLSEISSLMQQKAILINGAALSEIISIIRRSWVFVGNSSGPMHIAAALGVPVVAIFGNIHPLDSYISWRPLCKDYIVVHKDLNCRGCHPSDCRKYHCLDKISPQEVYEAVCLLLDKKIKSYD